MIRDKISHKRLLCTLIASVAIASAGWFAWYWFLSEDMREYRISQQSYIGHAHAVTDLSDDKKLAGFVQNIFIGRVLEKSGQTEEYGWPETQFKVRVLDVFKGTVEGEITVNQQGGNWEEGGSKYRMEGDPELLQPGRAYLFATRVFSEKDWHTVMPGYGDIKIEAADLGDDGKLLKSEHAEELRARFEDAVVNEIPYDPSKR